MRRVITPEILDSPDCPTAEIEKSLRDLSNINRWFGGVSTSRKLIERVAAVTGKKHFSMLEVAAGFGEVPKVAGKQLERKGITLNITLLDRMRSHLLPGNHSVVADALALPFPDSSFDLVSSSLFAHHLEPAELALFAEEALRVSRIAVLINDLIRHPLHLALVYAGFPLMRSYVSRVDGVASVRRAYVPEEMRTILTDGQSHRNVDISRNYLFRMGVIVGKQIPRKNPRVRAATIATNGANSSTGSPKSTLQTQMPTFRTHRGKKTLNRYSRFYLPHSFAFFRKAGVLISLL